MGIYHRFIFCVVVLFVVALPSAAKPGDTVLLERFTDVQAVMTAVAEAKADATSLVQQATKQSDKQHLQKVVQSFDDAITGGFTAANLEHFVNDVRLAVQSLEAVQGQKAAAQEIAGDVMEAVRAMAEEFLANVELAIANLEDATIREAAEKDFAKSRDDYARGTSAISAGRRFDAVDHFRQAIRRMIEFPLEPVESIIRPIVFENGSLVFQDEFGNVIREISVSAERFVTFSPSFQRVMVFDPTDAEGIERNVEVYDQTGVLVWSRNDILPLSLAVADDGSFAMYASTWMSNLNEFIFCDATGNVISSGPEFRSVARPNGSYLGNELFVTAYNWLPSDPQDHIHQTIYLRGIDVLTGQQRFITELSYTDVRMREFEFLSVNPQRGEICLWLFSRTDNRMRFYVFSRDGVLLGVRDSL